MTHKRRRGTEETTLVGRKHGGEASPLRPDALMNPGGDAVANDLDLEGSSDFGVYLLFFARFLFQILK